MKILKINKVLLILSLIFGISFITNYNNYDGNKLIFLIFHIICLISILKLFNKKISSIEFYLIVFFILSFWLKFSYLIYTKNFSIIEGNYNVNKSTLDDATLIIIVSLLACVFSGYIREILIENKIKLKKFIIKNSFKNFYKKYKLLIILALIFYLFSIYIINFNFKVHAKGIVNSEVILIVKYFFAWNYTYGFALLVSILLFMDYKIYKNEKLNFLVILEPILSSITSLSRAGIVFFLVYLRGLFQIGSSIFFKKKKILSIFKNVILILIILFSTIYLTSHLRNENYKIIKSEINIKSQLDLIKELVILRWIGIDGVLAVSQKENKSFKLFYDSIRETESKNLFDSFYVNNFFKKAKIDSSEELMYHKNENENVFRIITPGIVSVLSYTGSKVFLFFSLTAIIILLIILERFFFIFSGSNYILTNIIGFSLSYRLIHFGYLPINTIYFLLSYFVTLFFVYLLSKLILEIK